MVLNTCNIDGCRQPAERTFGSCMICAKNLCLQHISPEHHKCPSRTDDLDAYYAAYDAAKASHLDALLAKINVSALKSIASNIRDGIPCRIPAFDLDRASRAESIGRQMGGQNCHVDVDFDDGVTWIVRIRLTDPTLPPQPVQNYIFLSEVATLKFLAKTSVPAPVVYYYQVESPETPVGASYIIMQKISGKPLDWYSATKEHRTRIMDQLADVFLELEKYPFEKTGSIVMGDPPGQIGGFSQTPLFTTPETQLGPFTTLNTSYTAGISQQLETIANGEVTSLPIDNYLAFRWRLSALPTLLSSSDANKSSFYLKHYDDKSDHILIDDGYNITGIIDWEFAPAEAKDLAFSSPCMMWPVGDYYDGANNLSEEEVQFAQIFKHRGREDLGDIVSNSRRWQRFLFYLGGGVSTDQTEFQSLFQGLRKSFATNNRQPISSYESWRLKAISTYSKEDAILQRLLREERSTR